MSKIALLENGLINKIAAGEVVERPSSVVKELIENSIDAGATNITVEICEGGLSMIRITDNGSGIAKDDLRTAFLRHATSKISDFRDLENVLTLGFRGEALSSICEVSQLEMITKTASDSIGSRIQVHGGKIVSEQNVASLCGSTVLVGNLFYNTPARRKFLKKPSVESGYITDIIQKLALGHPEVGVKYINNSSVILQTNGNNDLKTVVYHIYGKDTAQKLISVSGESKGVILSGVTGRPEICRANRTYESFFINGRYIRSQIIRSALESAYKTRLMNGKFPFCVLKLNIMPDTVDVNVHPTKMEVRFSDEDTIYGLVMETVSKALSNEILIPSVKPKDTKAQIVPKESETMRTRPAAPSEHEDNRRRIFLSEPTKRTRRTAHIESGYTQTKSERNILAETHTPVKLEERIDDLEGKNEVGNMSSDGKLFVNYKILGQIFHTYWIVEQNESLYLIDQHAAHERTLYEELLKKLRRGDLASQKMLIPDVIKLGELEREVYRENSELIKSFGFEVSEGTEEGEFFVKSVPYIFNKPSGAGFFSEIIDKLNAPSERITDIYETKLDIIASVSCKAAVKANDRLSYQEARAIIEAVIKLENPFTCPHGRPTIVEMSKYEIEKIFKRKGTL